jgi:transcriptional regulator with XRE-family HTH domain
LLRLQAFGLSIRAVRRSRDLSQEAVGARLGRTQGFVSLVERGRHTGLTVADADRLCEALGATLVFGVEAPILVDGPRQRDAAHARCVGYVARRLRAAGWWVEREVEIGRRKRPGWIDILAFDPDTRVLLVIEVKTELVDLGGLERQLGWYEREAMRAARRLGWSPIAMQAAALLLATATNDERLRQNAESIVQAFPRRWSELMAVVGRSGTPAATWAIGMIDPHSKARVWCRATVLDGRRTAAPYRTAGDYLQSERSRRRRS